MSSVLKKKQKITYRSFRLINKYNCFTCKLEISNNHRPQTSEKSGQIYKAFLQANTACLKQATCICVIVKKFSAGSTVGPIPYKVFTTN